MLVAVSVLHFSLTKRCFSLQPKPRFTAEELVELTDVLEIPDIFVTSSRHHFPAIEALALLCARFRSSGEIHELSIKYNRAQSAISEIVKELSTYLDETWKHLLDFDHQHLLSTANLAHYARAIHQAGAPLHTIWSFIDCTLRQMCRPSQWQRQAYSGHKKYHCLKFQALSLPNGLFGHLFGLRLSIIMIVFKYVIIISKYYDYNTPVA
jgi:nuclease HARBI1